MDVPAVISLVGMAGSLAGWLLGRRDAKKDQAERRTEEQAAAKRMTELVDAAREHAERAGQLADAAEQQALSADRSASGVEAIAEALAPSRFVLEWCSHTRFVLRNTSPAPARIESIGNASAFLREPFTVPASVAARSGIEGLATDTWGQPFPPELVLDITGEDEPVIVPTAGRPPRT